MSEKERFLNSEHRVESMDFADLRRSHEINIGNSAVMYDKRNEGWRYSKSSVSSIYHSAQDISDLISDNFSDFSEPRSPHRSFHSVHDSTYETDQEEIFCSPQSSPVFPGKKSGKSVAFQVVMASADVDFCLVVDGSNEASMTKASSDKRKIFEKNLEDEGLKLERERIESGDLHFIKIHAPIEVLRRYCEILKLRMPMKELQGEIVDLILTSNGYNEYDFEDSITRSNLPESSHRLPHLTSDLPNGLVGEALAIPRLKGLQDGTTKILSGPKNWINAITGRFKVDPEKFPPVGHRLTAIYSRDKEYLFDDRTRDFFTPSVISRIIEFILKRKRYTADCSDDFAFGIERLLKDSVYSAAYPLHDGDLKTPGSQRHLLFTEWSALGKCLKYQPLDAVKEYFGVKIGLYFAWLGFYTHMLIPASLLGFLCFLYGCLTLKANEHSEDICDSSLNITMCPLCDRLCDFWSLHDACFYARLTYLFDNDATVLFAALMSLWTAIFIEFWKRYSAEITHRWDLTGFDIQEEHPRPEYLVRLKHVRKKHVNVVTNTSEPYVPFWRMKLPYTVFSISMVLLLISLAVVAVLAVVVYRMALTYAFSKQATSDKGVHSWGLIVVNSTAAAINLVFIYIFNWLYSFLALYLTELELQRTQTEFDDSLTLKMYLLEFVNYYSSIFYIAFLKGKFVGYPSKYTRMFSYRQEECGPGGCMTELCIQLAIIMVGKQVMNTLIEMLSPLAVKWFNNFKLMTGLSSESKHTVLSNQWMKDYRLLDWGPRSLFPEYLEMVLQFGFITIFVTAFPLAPLFALVNNIFEMRLDAKKLLIYYRRPVGQRVKDIGIWYGILDAIGKLAVISNAFIIAFSSNFVPKLVYKYSYWEKNSENYGTLNGFLNHSLAYFSTADLDVASASSSPPEICRYQAYRHSYDVEDEIRYKKTSFYWKVWFARLAFIVIFENLVAVCVMLLKWVIPDIPKKLSDKIRRENYITNEIIIKQELRARGVAEAGDSTAWNPVSTDTDLELVRVSSTDQNNMRKRTNHHPDSQMKSSGESEVMM